MSLSQKLLLLVVDLEDAFEADERDAADDGALKVGVDSLKQQLAKYGGYGWQNEAAANGARERDGIRVGRVVGRRARQILTFVWHKRKKKRRK